MDSAEELSTDERHELAWHGAPLKPSIERFLGDQIAADEFEAEFLRQFQQITGYPSDAVAETLNQAFFAVDDYVGHGMAVESVPGGIDADQLKAKMTHFARLAGWLDSR